MEISTDQCLYSDIVEIEAGWKGSYDGGYRLIMFFIMGITDGRMNF